MESEWYIGIEDMRSVGLWCVGFELDGGRGGSRERYLIVVVGLEASRCFCLYSIVGGPLVDVVNVIAT